MQKKALMIIDIQNDITKNYKDVIGNINEAADWAVNTKIHVIYIRHENLSTGTRTFKPNTIGAESASDLNIVSENIFTNYITSYDKRKIDGMLRYYESNGCSIISLNDLLPEHFVEA